MGRAAILAARRRTLTPINQFLTYDKVRWSSLRDRLPTVGRIAVVLSVLGSPTAVSSQPPAGYAAGESAWQITFARGASENSVQAFWLDMCVAVLQIEPKTSIDIVSYGDLGQSAEANTNLAQKRGEWVFARIRSSEIKIDGRVRYSGSNIDPHRLRIVNKGGDEAGRESNQVEIFYR
jgi:hypothetical protein